MYTVSFDGKKAMQMLSNLVRYSDGFIKETKASERIVTSKLANLAQESFYEYLDQLAKVNPGILHHVYEWGAVGDPQERLFRLKKTLANNRAVITSDFLQSESVPPNGNEPFYNKATVMEEGITVVVNEVQAEALFFEVDGVEYFRTGPIVIENPGGPDVRGSFLEAFQDFYNRYFEDVYLRSIRFYQYFVDNNKYESNVKVGMKSSQPEQVGRKTALSWIMNLPDGDFA